ncbi:Peptidyl-prolyl cis-trans isomerase-like 1 [Cystobasidiomycetes sp. EMM_F5]
MASAPPTGPNGIDHVRPIVFFDIQIGDVSIGRLKLQLYDDIVPKTAENFRQLCTGETRCAGREPIVENSASGDFVNSDGTGIFSIYNNGGKFEDENFIAKHTGPGILSMANSGPHTNGCQFFLTTAAAEYLDGKHVVLGSILDTPENMLILRKIENVPTGLNNRPKNVVKIVECGEM